MINVQGDSGGNVGRHSIGYCDKIHMNIGIILNGYRDIAL